MQGSSCGRLPPTITPSSCLLSHLVFELTIDEETEEIEDVGEVI